MTTAVVSSNDNENLETYCLIWLNTSVNSSPENVEAQEQLRTSINHLLTFEDDQRCLEHIQSLSKDDRIVLIVSGRLGRIVVPQIVQLRQIVSIYVYFMDKEANEKWAQSFSKVEGVFVQLDELIQQIQTDKKQRQRRKIYEALVMSFFNSNIQNKEQSSTGLNPRENP